MFGMSKKQRKDKKVITRTKQMQRLLDHLDKPNVADLAKHLGIHRNNLYHWTSVPQRHTRKIVEYIEMYSADSQYIVDELLQ